MGGYIDKIKILLIYYLSLMIFINGFENLVGIVTKCSLGAVTE